MEFLGYLPFFVVAVYVLFIRYYIFGLNTLTRIQYSGKRDNKETRCDVTREPAFGIESGLGSGCVCVIIESYAYIHNDWTFIENVYVYVYIPRYLSYRGIRTYRHLYYLWKFMYTYLLKYLIFHNISFSNCTRKKIHIIHRV